MAWVLYGLPQMVPDQLHITARCDSHQVNWHRLTSCTARVSATSLHRYAANLPFVNDETVQQCEMCWAAETQLRSGHDYHLFGVPLDSNQDSWRAKSQSQANRAKDGCQQQPFGVTQCQQQPARMHTGLTCVLTCLHCCHWVQHCCGTTAVQTQIYLPEPVRMKAMNSVFLTPAYMSEVHRM